MGLEVPPQGTLCDHVCPRGSALSSAPADESSLKMNHVEHTPQSPASHSGGRLWDAHGADMLRPDPRDTFFLSKGLGPGPRLAPGGNVGGKKAGPGCHGHPEHHCYLLPSSGVAGASAGGCRGQVGMV